jgi:hypothetical protein
LEIIFVGCEYTIHWVSFLVTLKNTNNLLFKK